MQRTIGLAAAVSVSLVACGGPSWPSRATALTQPVAPTPVQSIDILPLDLEVWTHAGFPRDADDVRLSAESRIVGLATETFYRRGYSVGAVMDWNGTYVASDGTPRVALGPADLLATVDSLASYGTAVADSQQLPAPFLPTRLGSQTGADATLYVGGWGFVGKEPDRGALVGKIVVGTILVVGIVAIAVVASKGGKHLDPLGKAVGGAARGVAVAARSVGRTALRATMRAGSAMIEVGRAAAHAGDGVELVLDAMGRSSTHIQLVSGRPEWSSAPTTPRSGRPRMYLEMTLVDNRTGVVLWHAHQQFPANAARPTDVVKATRTLLASLPAR